MHSIGGGTGSGLGSLLLEKLTEEYSEKLAMNFSVMPGSTYGNSDLVVEPYNSILTLNALIENSHGVFQIENSALHRICQSNLKMNQPSFADINHLIAQGISNCTATLRFPGYQNNCDFRKLSTNLVPFPRMHFLLQGQAPLIANKNKAFEQLNVKDVCAQLFDARSMFNNGDAFNLGKILTASCLLRGENLSTYESEEALRHQLTKHKNQFVEWIPDNMMNTICKVPAANKASNVSGTFLANSSVSTIGLKNLSEQFQKMFNKKAYVHWYTAEGMDPSEFTEALSNVTDLIAEYQQYENAAAYEEGGDGEGDEEMEDMNEAMGYKMQFKGSFKPNSSI